MVFTSKVDPAKTIGEKPSLAKILAVALEQEKESVVIYAGMKRFVPASPGAHNIEASLQEEVSQVAMSTQRLAEVV